MSKVRKSLNEVFDVEDSGRTDIVTPKDESDNLPMLSDDKSDIEVINSDVEYAADNIRKLIDMGMVTVEDATYVAKDSESPRAYEVVSNMIKNLTDMNLQLIDIHGKKNEALGRGKSSGESSGGTNNGVVNNTTVFVGTPHDLNKIIEQQMNDNIIDMEVEDNE